jgi:CheY-like chemotaxis protein
VSTDDGFGASKATILVVDDEDDVVYMLRVILQHAGFDVVSASNGREALERLDEHALALVLTDLRMPVMNGDELVQELERRTEHPPVIIMTAYGTPLSVPGKGFMMKPFTREQLIDQIQSTLPAD